MHQYSDGWTTLIYTSTIDPLGLIGHECHIGRISESIKWLFTSHSMHCLQMNQNTCNKHSRTLDMQSYHKGQILSLGMALHPSVFQVIYLPLVKHILIQLPQNGVHSYGCSFHILKFSFMCSVSQLRQHGFLCFPFNHLYPGSLVNLRHLVGTALILVPS